MANINESSIQQSDIRWLGMAIASAVEEYFSDEKNLEEYERWRRERRIPKSG